MLNRRSGGPEPSWEKFLAALRRAPWWRRLDQERQGLSFALYNAAISHFSRRRYHLFLPYLLSATLLEPDLVLARLLSRTGISKTS
jgi:hypothetical protein